MLLLMVLPELCVEPRKCISNFLTVDVYRTTYLSRLLFLMYALDLQRLKGQIGVAKRVSDMELLPSDLSNSEYVYGHAVCLNS